MEERKQGSAENQYLKLPSDLSLSSSASSLIDLSGVKFIKTAMGLLVLNPRYSLELFEERKKEGGGNRAGA